MADTPKKTEPGARVHEIASSNPNEHIYTTKALVDDRIMDLTLVENEKGVRGNKTVLLSVSKENQTAFDYEINPNPPTDDFSATNAAKYNSIQAPHVQAMAPKNSGITGALTYGAAFLEGRLPEWDVANQAPDIVKIAEKAVFGKESPNAVTVDEFRAIREKLQHAEADAAHATNKPLPDATTGKSSGYKR